MACDKLLFLCATIAFVTADISLGGLSAEDKCNIGLNFTPNLLSMDFINEAKNDSAYKEVFFEKELPGNVTDWSISTRNSYLKVEVIKRKLTVTPSKNFANLEFEQTWSASEPFTLDASITLRCGKFWDKTEFTFIQPIIDVNEHAPRFNRKEYNFRFGMAIKEGADLTDFMDIYAVDIDFTNTKLEFTIEPNNNIEISYKKSERNKKIHYPALKTMKTLGSGTYTYKISATDKGKPTLKGEATIKVRIN